MYIKLLAGLAATALLIAGCAPATASDNRFASFDRDGNGSINQEEYSREIAGYGTQPEFARFDNNGDGSINREEFRGFGDGFGDGSGDSSRDGSGDGSGDNSDSGN